MNKIEELLAHIAQEEFAEAVAVFVQLNASRMDDAAARALAKAMAQVPAETLKSDPVACYYMCLLARRLDDKAQMRAWLAAVVAIRSGKKEGTKDWAELSILVNAITLTAPDSDNGMLILLLSMLHYDLTTYELNLPPLCLTACRPSVFRGAHDLSELGKNGRAVASIITPMVENISDGEGVNVVGLALGELHYEKNDLALASAEVAKALASKNAEILFAAYNAMLRIGRVDDKARQSEDLIARMESMIAEHEAEYLRPNMQAVKARIAVHNGDLQAANEWLETAAPDELSAYTLWDAYQVFTKGQVYIATERYRDAVTLFEKLALLYKNEAKPADVIECLVHCAVACRLLGTEELALEKFHEAVALAIPYGYVRIFADGGARVARLATAYQESGAICEGEETFVEKVRVAAEQYAERMPMLYHTEDAEEVAEDAPVSDIELTSKELEILQLLDEGKSNNEICAELSIKLPTVKFHISHIYEKLDVPNRVSALNKAKELKLL